MFLCIIMLYCNNFRKTEELELSLTLSLSLLTSIDNKLIKLIHKIKAQMYCDVWNIYKVLSL